MADIAWEEVEGEGGGGFVKFNEIGQSTIGIFTGYVERQGKFGLETVINFAGYDGGEPFSLNANPDLKGKVKRLVVGKLVRVEYVSDLDVGKENPMKVFKVQQAPAPKSSGSTVDGVPF